MTYQNLSVDVDDGVATLTFDDADGRNAIDLQTANELVEAITSLGEDDAVRCVVLTHTGQFFCTGADLTGFEGDSSDATQVRRIAGRLHDAVIQFKQLEVPTVGGVDGVAAGAGFSLTLVPDLLVLSEDAELNYAYPRIGLTGDGGSTFFLPRLVGLRTAKEIALLDEPLDAERAVDLGLANEVADADGFEDRLAELAEDVAAGPTRAAGITMRLMEESFDRSMESQLAAETDRIAEAMHTEDYSRGLDAFFGDEPPEFVGR